MTVIKQDMLCRRITTIQAHYKKIGEKLKKCSISLDVQMVHQISLFICNSSTHFTKLKRMGIFKCKTFLNYSHFAITLVSIKETVSKIENSVSANSLVVSASVPTRV